MTIAEEAAHLGAQSRVASRRPRVTQGSGVAHGSFVAVALVPAAHTIPLAFQYIARSTAIG